MNMTPKVLALSLLVFRSAICNVFECHGDYCNSAKDQFCSATYRYCRNCADVRDDCGNTNQPLNCTPYCSNYRLEQDLQKERGKPCALLPGIANGNHSGHADSLHAQGDVVHSSCTVGYRLEGSEETTCGTSGLWSRPSPTCVEITCSSPFNIVNGEFRFTHGKYLSAPKEENATVVPPSESEGNTRVHYNTSVIYSCKHSYQLKGPAVWTCGHDGEWNQKTMASCHIIPIPPEVTCPPPLQIANGELRYSPVEHITSNSRDNPILPMMSLSKDIKYFPNATSIMYNCRQGYHLIGPSIWTCGEDGFWDQDTMVTCELDTVPSGEWYETKTVHVLIAISSAVLIGIVICVITTCACRYRTNKIINNKAEQHPDKSAVVEMGCVENQRRNMYEHASQMHVKTKMDEQRTAAEITEVKPNHRAVEMPSDEYEQSTRTDEESDRGSMSSQGEDTDATGDDHNQSKDSGIDSGKSVGTHPPSVLNNIHIDLKVTSNNINNNNSSNNNSNSSNRNNGGCANNNGNKDNSAGDKQDHCSGKKTDITTDPVEETSKKHRSERLPVQEYGKVPVYSQETGYDERCRPELSNNEISVVGPAALNDSRQ